MAALGSLECFYSQVGIQASGTLSGLLHGVLYFDDKLGFGYKHRVAAGDRGADALLGAHVGAHVWQAASAEVCGWKEEVGSRKKNSC